MNLKNLLKNYKKRTLFTTPSHNQGEFIIPYLKKTLGEKIFKNDFSELEGFDNIKDPQGAIKESMERASKIYEVDHTLYLTNGSTQGILTILLSCLNSDDYILVCRNCHQSVFDGVSLAKAKTVIFEPDFDEEWGIYKPVNPENLEDVFRQNPKVKAFVISHPYYEGVVSDIEKISKICKQYEKLLIVDEAHGALMSFDKSISVPSVFLGADAVVQSLHKTCGALNPCAVLHLPQNSRLDYEKIKETYNKLMTTSPSYPLLLCIEQTIEFLSSKNGKQMIYELVDNIIAFKKNCKDYPSIHFYDKNFDETKILVKIDGISGFELSKIMFEKYHIEDELANEVSVLYLTGIGTTKAKLKKLEKALKKVADKLI